MRRCFSFLVSLVVCGGLLAQTLPHGVERFMRVATPLTPYHDTVAHLVIGRPAADTGEHRITLSVAVDDGGDNTFFDRPELLLFYLVHLDWGLDRVARDGYALNVTLGRQHSQGMNVPAKGGYAHIFTAEDILTAVRVLRDQTLLDVIQRQVEDYSAHCPMYVSYLRSMQDSVVLDRPGRTLTYHFSTPAGQYALLRDSETIRQRMHDILLRQLVTEENRPTAEKYLTVGLTVVNCFLPETGDAIPISISILPAELQQMLDK